MKRIAIGTVLALVVAKLVLGGIRSRQKSTNNRIRG